MKKNNLLFGLIALAVVITSCEPSENKIKTVIDFEDVELGENGYWAGTDSTSSFTAGSIEFSNSYFEMDYDGYKYVVWSGFACSEKTDSVTSGYGNQYSVMAGSGAFDSKKFALAYDSASIVCGANIDGKYKIKSAMLTNSTYAYRAMVAGTEFSRIFSKEGDGGKGDWFKVTIKGYMSSVETGKVDYYLADFRNNKSFISKNWEKVDLSSLGEVDKITITFDSSDKSGVYLNNPAYVCIDNIEFEQTAKEVK